MSNTTKLELGRIQKCAIRGSPCNCANSSLMSFSEPPSELCFGESPLVEFWPSIKEEAPQAFEEDFLCVPQPEPNVEREGRKKPLWDSICLLLSQPVKRFSKNQCHALANSILVLFWKILLIKMLFVITWNWFIFEWITKYFRNVWVFYYGKYPYVTHKGNLALMIRCLRGDQQVWRRPLSLLLSLCRLWAGYLWEKGQKAHEVPHPLGSIFKHTQLADGGLSEQTVLCATSLQTSWSPCCGWQRCAVGSSSEVVSWSDVLRWVCVSSFWDKGSALPLTNDFFTEFGQSLEKGGPSAVDGSERQVPCFIFFFKS